MIDQDLDQVVDLDEAPLPAAFLGDCGFLTGAAGTGKTFLARALCATRPGWRLAASTGIAAVNLGGATTINSLLGYFDVDSLRTSVMLGHTQAKIRKLWKSGLARIILDEVSMVDAESLALIVQALDEVNGERTAEEGRIGLTLLGDFLQLSPVPEKVEGQRRNKPTAYAFESPVWERFAANTTTLTEIKRQADPAFIEALRACRRADLPTLLDYFGPRCQLNIEQEYPGLTIFSKNDQVARWNEMMHRKLTTPLHEFKTVRVDKQKSEWQAPPKGHIPDVLQLREGALVMVLANKIVMGGEVIVYANGDLGEFVGTEKKAVMTTDDRGKPLPKEVVCAKVRLQRNNTEVWVEPVVREYLQPTGALGVKKDAYEVLGSIDYMPLRLAYASSTHKTQSLSLDHVQVAFADPFFGQPGMLYVAFSRARSAEGLRIVGTPQLLRERCTVDKRVLKWL